jgi:hypothetical protein
VPPSRSRDQTSNVKGTISLPVFLIYLWHIWCLVLLTAPRAFSEVKDNYIFFILGNYQVLRILEGGDLAVPLSLDLNSVGNRSGRLHGVSLNTKPDGRRGHSRKLSHWKLILQ